MRKNAKFKPISLKEHQIWENQFHELNTYKETKQDESLKLLKMRYAKGEITKEEYIEMKVN